MSKVADSQGYFRDGNLAFSGGVDSGRPPSTLDRDQLASAINVTFRAGTAKPRPGWYSWPIVFNPGASDAQSAFQTGFFQQASAFQCPGGDPVLLTSIGGRQFSTDIFSLTQNQTAAPSNTQEITPKAALTTWTTASFTIPAVGATGVSVSVSDTSRMSLLYPNVTIGGYALQLVGITDDSTVQVANLLSAQAGIIVGVAVTTEAFTVPAIDSTVPIPVADDSQLSLSYPELTITSPGKSQAMQLMGVGTLGREIAINFTAPQQYDRATVTLASSTHNPTPNSGMSLTCPNIYIAGQPFQLISINANGYQITVQNNSANYTGKPIEVAAVTFTIADNTLIAANPGSRTAGQTNLMAPLTIPAIGSTAAQSLVSTSALPAPQSTPITISGVDYSVIAVNTPDSYTGTVSIVALNLTGSPGAIVAAGTAITGTSIPLATMAPFTIPAEGASVEITIASGSLMTIAGGVYMPTKITGIVGVVAQNLTATGVGNTVALGAVVTGASINTTTTAEFIVPQMGGWVEIGLASLTNIVSSEANLATLEEDVVGVPVPIVVGGVSLWVIAITGGTSATLYNAASVSQAGQVMPSATVVTFPMGSSGSGAGTVFPIGSAIEFLAAVSYIGVDQNDPDNQLNWCIQADQWWVLQDNASLPIIFNGAVCTRSSPSAVQIPTGNVMVYAQGRILVALPDFQTYMASDLIFGSSGTATNGYRDAMLYFTESRFIQEGGALSTHVYGAPAQNGNIVSMTALAQTDSSLGQGSVIIGTSGCMFTVNLPFDRTTWNSQILQTVVPITGPTGQDSSIQINSDLWYRSLDGIRSYMIAQRQFNGSWGNTPMSNEVDVYLDLDTDTWIQHASAVFFNGRLLTTINPRMTPQGVAFAGLAAMDFDPTTSLRKKGQPAWEGIWTGLLPAVGSSPCQGILKILTAMVNGVQRCFMFVLNALSQIELWELSVDDKFDQGYAQVPISGTLISPSYNFGNDDGFKSLEAGRILVTAVSGQVTYCVRYRTDEWPCWNQWFCGTCCSQNQDCGPFACSGPTSFQDQPRRPIRLPLPKDDFNPVTNILNRCGYEIQVRIDFTGYWEIKQLRVYAKDAEEMLGLDRPDEEVCNVVTVGTVTYLADANGNQIIDSATGLPIVWTKY